MSHKFRNDILEVFTRIAKANDSIANLWVTMAPNFEDNLMDIAYGASKETINSAVEDMGKLCDALKEQN